MVSPPQLSARASLSSPAELPRDTGIARAEPVRARARGEWDAAGSSRPIPRAHARSMSANNIGRRA